MLGFVILFVARVWFGCYSGLDCLFVALFGCLLVVDWWVIAYLRGLYLVFNVDY